MTRGARSLAFLLTALAVAPTASAAPVLIATGTLTGTSDLSGLSAPLENGLPGDILGGLGSGLAYAGGNTFLALPDRGPNATSYDTNQIDDTVSYVNRFHTVTMTLTPSGSGLPFTLSPTLNNTTLLYSSTPLTYGKADGPGNHIGNQYNGMPIGSGAPAQNTANKFYFTGRSDNFDSSQSSGNSSNARLDPKLIRVANDGKSVFISDEYGPYVYQFDRATGERIKSFQLPANLDVSNLSPVGATEISGNTSGRTANKGMEGLAITPDGKTLVGIMQAALIQDNAVTASKKLLRIVTIDIATGTTHEYGYKLTNGTGISDIVAINDHEFLVDERDGKGLGDGSAAVVKQLYKIDLSGATDITDLTGSAAAAAAASKTLFLDIVSALTTELGLDPTQIPSKIEGLAFGQDVMLNGELKHTLYVSNDNDFVPSDSGPNQFYVFGFTSGINGDLPGFVQQQLPVPEPSSMSLIAGAVFGFGLWRRREGAELTGFPRYGRSRRPDRRVRTPIGRLASARYTSRLATLSAFDWMKSRRGSTRSPISVEKVSSARSSWLTRTCSSERISGSSVVSQS